MKKSTNFSDVKYILIDIDDTILDFRKCAAYSMTEAAKKLNIDIPECFPDVFHRINNALWAKVERGELTSDILHNTRWGMIFDELGIAGDGVLFEKHFRAALKECAIPVDGIGELLPYLSKKYILVTASNSSYDQQVKRLKIAGFYEYFTKVFVPENIGYTKPTKEFFKGCLEGIGGKNPNIDEFVMIGDSVNADVKGAHDFGLKTIWFNKKNRPEEEGYMADKIVYDVRDIMKIL